MRQRTWQTAAAFNYVYYSEDELKALHFKSHVGLVSLSHCFNERTLIPVCAIFVRVVPWILMLGFVLGFGGFFLQT